jgi:hypothetical protein
VFAIGKANTPLERRMTGRDKNYFVKQQRFLGVARCRNMTFMDRVETTSI